MGSGMNDPNPTPQPPALHDGKCWRCGKVLDLLHDAYDAEDEFDFGDEDLWRCRDRRACQTRAGEKAVGR